MARRYRIQRHRLTNTDLYCTVCGYPMFLDNAGDAHHLTHDLIDVIDWDRDADHEAVDGIKPDDEQRLDGEPVNGPT